MNIKFEYKRKIIISDKINKSKIESKTWHVFLELWAHALKADLEPRHKYYDTEHDLFVRHLKP